MTTSEQLLLDLESESEDEERFIMLHLLNQKRKRGKTNEYLRKRETHREFNLSSEIPGTVFKKSFRLNRRQFSEVHELIKNDITGQECNAQKPIGSEERLAVRLR
ncbi:hypothetical protein JTB14_006670 [Gonioctena quinquepunctata]|nr:hypothetical protein JTB14_006670 [Gonioctena quinquepunctata]